MHHLKKSIKNGKNHLEQIVNRIEDDGKWKTAVKLTDYPILKNIHTVGPFIDSTYSYYKCVILRNMKLGLHKKNNCEILYDGIIAIIKNICHKVEESLKFLGFFLIRFHPISLPRVIRPSLEYIKLQMKIKK